VGGRLLQFGARLRDTIDLGKQCGFIGRRRLYKLVHLRLGLMHIVESRDQRGAVLLQDGVHVGLLLRTELQAFHEGLVVPPASGRAEFQTWATISAWTMLSGLRRRAC